MSDEIKVLVAGHGVDRNLVMYYVDPVTEKRVARSTGTKKRREADRAAAVWQDEVNSGRYFASNRITWGEFRERYEEEKLVGLAEKTRDSASSALNHLQRVVNPKKLRSVNSATLSRFQSRLRAEGMKDTTLASHLRHVRAALSWGVSVGLLAKVPQIHMPRRVKGRPLMRGRPVGAAEFDDMILTVPDVRPQDPDAWTRFLTGLWLSGLRLEEATILSWDPEAPFGVDLSGRHPRFRIYAEAEKGHADRLLPMTPDFADFLLRTPQADRRGLVLPIRGLLTGEPMTSGRVGRIVGRIGRRAGVIVNEAEGKFATAHDLRRAFGTRWAPRVKPATLQLLMRHASIQTTLAYYVALDADDVADELWAQHDRPHTLPHTGSESAENERGAPEKRQRNPLDGNTF